MHSFFTLKLLHESCEQSHQHPKLQDLNISLSLGIIFHENTVTNLDSSWSQIEWVCSFPINHAHVFKNCLSEKGSNMTYFDKIMWYRSSISAVLRKHLIFIDNPSPSLSNKPGLHVEKKWTCLSTFLKKHKWIMINCSQKGVFWDCNSVPASKEELQHYVVSLKNHGSLKNWEICVN